MQRALLPVAVELGDDKARYHPQRFIADVPDQQIGFVGRFFAHNRLLRWMVRDQIFRSGAPPDLLRVRVGLGEEEHARLALLQRDDHHALVGVTDGEAWGRGGGWMDGWRWMDGARRNTTSFKKSSTVAPTTRIRTRPRPERGACTRWSTPNFSPKKTKLFTKLFIVSPTLTVIAPRRGLGDVGEFRELLRLYVPSFGASSFFLAQREDLQRLVRAHEKGECGGLSIDVRRGRGRLGRGSVASVRHFVLIVGGFVFSGVARSQCMFGRRFSAVRVEKFI